MLDVRSAALVATLLLLAPAGAESQTASGTPAVRLVGLATGQTVSGALAVEARVTGSGIRRVEFAIDGRTVRTERSYRYCLAGGDSTCQKWDSRSVADGSHIIKATAYDSAGRSGSASAVVTVRNGASASPSPMPTPTPTPTPEPSVPIGRVSLSWTPGEGGDPAASFRVYVAPLGGAFEPRASTSDTSVPLSGLGLTVGAIYSARVTAVSASGVESAPSSEVTFRYQP